MTARNLAYALAPLVLSFVAGCGSSTANPLGTLGAACYAPETDADVDAGRDGGTLRCNAGLACQANVCVRPAGGGELVDSASEPVGDAASEAASDAAVDGGAPADASLDADGAPPADGAALETAADAPPAEGGADAAAADGATTSDGASDAVDGGTDGDEVGGDA